MCIEFLYTTCIPEVDVDLGGAVQNEPKGSLELCLQ